MKNITQAQLLALPRLERDFYVQEDCAWLAQQLLGKILVVNKNDHLHAGRIVETEAYLGPHDLAAHSSKGITPRTQIIFGIGGYAYVYLIYGLHHCMNIVTGPEDSAAAVLLRAVEPVLNINKPSHGPGRLSKAMGIDRQDNGVDLCGNRLFIIDAPSVPSSQCIARPRIGVDYAGEWAKALLRFYIKDNPYVSKK